MVLPEWTLCNVHDYGPGLFGMQGAEAQSRKECDRARGAPGYVSEPASLAQSTQPFLLMGRHHAATLPLEFDCDRARSIRRRRKHQHVRHAPLESSGLQAPAHRWMTLTLVRNVAPQYPRAIQPAR